MTPYTSIRGVEVYPTSNTSFLSRVIDHIKHPEKDICYLLEIHGIDHLLSVPAFEKKLYYILTHGKSSGISVIATSEHYENSNTEPILELFQLRIKSIHNASKLLVSTDFEILPR